MPRQFEINFDSDSNSAVTESSRTNDLLVEVSMASDSMQMNLAKKKTSAVVTLSKEKLIKNSSSVANLVSKDSSNSHKIDQKWIDFPEK